MYLDLHQRANISGKHTMYVHGNKKDDIIVNDYIHVAIGRCFILYVNV